MDVRFRTCRRPACRHLGSRGTNGKHCGRSPDRPACTRLTVVLSTRVIRRMTPSRPANSGNFIKRWESSSLCERSGRRMRRPARSVFSHAVNLIFKQVFGEGLRIRTALILIGGKICTKMKTSQLSRKMLVRRVITLGYTNAEPAIRRRGGGNCVFPHYLLAWRLYCLLVVVRIRKASFVDILHLRYFSAVYESLNYSKSATDLFISRQALRQAIQNLEKEIGQALFDNDANKLVATSAANLLYASVQPVLLSFNELEHDIAAMRGKTLLRVGSVPNTNIVFTEDERRTIYANQKHVYPANVTVEFVSGSCEALRKKVLGESLVCAFLLATEVDDDLFDTFVSRRGCIHLMVNVRHPLAERDQVTIDDLKGLPFATQGNGYDLHDLISMECLKKGFRLSVGYTSPSIYDNLSSVSANTAVTYGVRERCGAEDVVGIPFSEPCMEWVYCVITKKSLPENPLVKQIFCKNDPSEMIPS